MTINPWVGTVALHEQDLEAAKAWWKDTPNFDRLRVWKAIQDMEGSPIKEIISRLAQIGFSEVARLCECPESDQNLLLWDVANEAKELLMCFPTEGREAIIPPHKKQRLAKALLKLMEETPLTLGDPHDPQA